MSSSRIMKWITGGLEALLAIPLVGGTIVIGFYYIPLVVMLILHIITLVMSIRQNGSIYGSVLGIVTSLIAWIPFVGWVMHVITAIFLIISAAKPEQ